MSLETLAFTPATTIAGRVALAAAADPEPFTKIILATGAVCILGFCAAKYFSLQGSPTSFHHRGGNGSETEFEL